MNDHHMLPRAIKVIGLLTCAVVIAIATTFAAAWLGHQVLVVTVGEEGIPAIDDTPLMFALVSGAYIAGGIAGLAVAAYGWLRFFSRRA